MAARRNYTALMGLVLLLGTAGCSLVGPVDAGFPPAATRAGAAALPPTGAAPVTPTSLPTASPSPLPSPTPVPVLRQLTSGGCCVDPFWHPDGQHVLFLDRPNPDMSAGIWGVNIAGGEPQLFTDRLGIFSADLQWRVFPENGQAVVERLEDGQRWVIPSGGRPVALSPDSTQVYWTQGQDGPPFDRARSDIWISRLDGSDARAVLTVFSGGPAGWLPDGRLLVRGRTEPSQEGDTLWVLSPQDGALVELAHAHRMRGILASPGGSWVAYQVTFSPQEAENGLWLVSTQGGPAFRLEQFGAYRWRDDARLLVVPQDLSSPVHRFWEVDARDPQAARYLTDPVVTPLRIANNDWVVSPDGRWGAYVSADDHNLWLLSLPD